MSQPKVPTVYLSRRNLLTLLSKLDRAAAGEATMCAIEKRDTEHPLFPQTMKTINVVAVEDDIYYAHRNPGAVHPSDDPNMKSESEQEFDKETFDHREQISDFKPEPQVPSCDHIAGKFICHSGLRSEIYECTKCHQQFSKRYYEWQR